MARVTPILLTAVLAAVAPAAETASQPAASRPAVINLDAEWQFQFEDLSQQIAGWDKHVAQVQRFRRAGYMTPLDHASDLVQ